jgi:hypothetical protein
VIACQVGEFRAMPSPRANVKPIRVHGVIKPANVQAARRAAAASIQPCVNSSKRRRSRMSATAPAGSPTRNTGRLVAPWISATISGEEESEVMYHAAATFCIQVPMLDTSAAIQRPRKTG